MIESAKCVMDVLLNMFQGPYRRISGNAYGKGPEQRYLIVKKL
jgi:hypothetical protein